MAQYYAVRYMSHGKSFVYAQRKKVFFQRNISVLVISLPKNILLTQWFSEKICPRMVFIHTAKVVRYLKVQYLPIC